MLKIRNLNTYYGAIHALKGIDLDVPEGKIVTLVGSNGAGKSTTVLSATGILKVAEGSVIELNGENIANMGPHKIVKRASAFPRKAGRCSPPLRWRRTCGWVHFRSGTRKSWLATAMNGSASYSPGSRNA